MNDMHETEGRFPTWLVVILLTIIFYRVLFHHPIDERLMPTLFILIAPPAVGFIAYTRLTGGELDTFARVLYYSGLFLTLLLFTPGRALCPAQVLPQLVGVLVSACRHQHREHGHV